MSAGYSISLPGNPVVELLGGRLTKYGIGDAQSAATDENQRCLTDGMDHYLWVYGNPVKYFARYYPNRWTGFMLQMIANEFEVEIYSDPGQGDEDPQLRLMSLWGS